MKQIKDENVIAALLSSSTIREAAITCGLSEPQIYKRLKDSNFKKKYDEARVKMLEAATNKIQSKLTDAIDVISEIAMNEDNSPAIRLQACNSIIRNSLKMTEQLDILQRLKTLEDCVL